MMIKGLNHVGLSVVSMDRSLDFYCRLLGLKLVSQRVFGDERFDTILRLKGATGRVALLRAGTLQLELFEFSHPVPRPSGPDRPVCDHGITHISVEVEDIDYEYRRLCTAGVVFHCPPIEFKGIAKATYARDPDGNVLEVLQMTIAAPSSGSRPA
jgi:glyoxylase I family protein